MPITPWKWYANWRFYSSIHQDQEDQDRTFNIRGLHNIAGLCRHSIDLFEAAEEDYPLGTRRCWNVESTPIRRWFNVATTSCAQWVWIINIIMRVLVFRYSRAPNECPCSTVIVANIPHVDVGLDCIWRFCVLQGLGVLQARARYAQNCHSLPFIRIFTTRPLLDTTL